MPINPIYVQPNVKLTGPVRPTTNYPEAFKGEKETLLKIYNEYIKPYKNAPKGRAVTTMIDIDPSVRNFVLQIDSRLRDLGALPPKAGNSGIMY